MGDGDYLVSLCSCKGGWVFTGCYSLTGMESKVGRLKLDDTEQSFREMLPFKHLSHIIEVENEMCQYRLRTDTCPRTAVPLTTHLPNVSGGTIMHTP